MSPVAAPHVEVDPRPAALLGGAGAFARQRAGAPGGAALETRVQRESRGKGPARERMRGGHARRSRAAGGTGGEGPRVQRREEEGPMTRGVVGSGGGGTAVRTDRAHRVAAFSLERSPTALACSTRWPRKVRRHERKDSQQRPHVTAAQEPLKESRCPDLEQFEQRNKYRGIGL